MRTPENINNVHDLVLSQKNAPQTHRTTRQIERSSRCCQIFGVCHGQGTSSYSSRTADLHTVHGHHRAATTWNPRLHWTRCLASEFTRPQSSWLAYMIWGLIQERIYQRAIQDTDNLKQRLTCVWAELKQSVDDKAIEQWRPRLRACICAKGQHFEQLLNWTLHFLV